MYIGTSISKLLVLIALTTSFVVGAFFGATSLHVYNWLFDDCSISKNQVLEDKHTQLPIEIHK